MTEKNQSNRERTERKKAKKSYEWELELLADWTKDLELAFADWTKEFDLGFDLNLGIEPEEDATKQEKEVKNDKSK